MAIREIKYPITDRIPVRHVLASVYDKTGLAEFTRGLLEFCPEVRFYSTGGTYATLKRDLGDRAGERLVTVESFTAMPEMEGGLVKTLHPKVHAGLLGERNNPEHRRFLEEVLGGGVFFDMLLSGLYPFERVVAEPGATFEHARGNIDIGGPAMLRAGAKNFHSCMVVVEPRDYAALLEILRANQGMTSFEDRFERMQTAFRLVAEYDRAIAEHMTGVTAQDAAREYAAKGLLG